MKQANYDAHKRFNIKYEHASCHTAVIDGYVIEGHVPAEGYQTFTAEKPDAIGLSAPECQLVHQVWTVHTADAKILMMLFLIKKTVKVKCLNPITNRGKNETPRFFTLWN
ncbi:MAG: DUF411 domain-containing protein [Haemophilus parainfluenzae]